MPAPVESPRAAANSATANEAILGAPSPASGRSVCPKPRRTWPAGGWTESAGCITTQSTASSSRSASARVGRPASVTRSAQHLGSGVGPRGSGAGGGHTGIAPQATDNPVRGEPGSPQRARGSDAAVTTRDAACCVRQAGFRSGHGSGRVLAAPRAGGLTAGARAGSGQDGTGLGRRHGRGGGAVEAAAERAGGLSVRCQGLVHLYKTFEGHDVVALQGRRPQRRGRGARGVPRAQRLGEVDAADPLRRHPAAQRRAGSSSARRRSPG